MSKFHALIAIAALTFLATSVSCSINDYCVGCEVGDGGHGTDDANDGGEDPDDSGIDASCVPTGSEVCDGEDNDCNGLADDGVLPQVGTNCANQTGPCSGGKLSCTSGVLTCDKAPMPEQCDGIDNNCNGATDEGDPGGGGKCGTDVGECVAGTNVCNVATGQVECTGFQDFRTDPEICDGKDNDCDGMLDDGIGSLGSCGPSTDAGRCEFGTLVCQGGAPVCQNAVLPTFETCNNIDDDCDSDPAGPPGNGIDEIFDKSTDPNNCVTCNTVCPTASKTCINATNNSANCTTTADCTGTSPAKNCVINSQRRCISGCTYACNAGFKDLDLAASNGCEYKCSPTGSEECDGVDNDCNGMIDEGLTAPVGLCRSGGECGSGVTATCGGAAGWSCAYPGMVQFPETRCDDLDNDCDSNIDENQPNKNNACDDGRIGACRGTGAFACNTTNRDLAAVCNITSPGQSLPSAEQCDDEDNNCNGVVDEGSETGTLIGQEWVDIGAGIEIMKYEASRRDSTDTQQGSKSGSVVSTLVAAPGGATQSGSTATFTTTVAHGLSAGMKVRVSGVSVSGYSGLWTIVSTPTTTSFTATLPTTGLAASGGGSVFKFVGACSKAGAIPWTNVTYPEALAVCESMGASLCSESTWHHACSAVTPRTTPIAISNGTTATSGTMIEAEDFFRNRHAGGPETACTGLVDDDGDGRANDGCPAFSSGAGPEAVCNDAVDNDGDGRINDGCPTQEEGGETICTGTTANDDDGDGRANDGCPAFEQGPGPETICTGTTNNDDDGDGRANDGCPAVGAPETGGQCNDNSDNDGDGVDNDGCPATSRGAGPETGAQCNNNDDEDGDGRDNDGCPAVITGAGPETGADCDDATDDDNDNFINDGCPEFIGGGEEGIECDNNVDDDGDAIANDGCPARGPQAWVEDYTPANSTLTQPQQHSGIANMKAVVNVGTTTSLASSLTEGPMLEYHIDIPSTETDWRLYVRMYSIDANDDSVHFGFDASATPVAPTTTLSHTTYGSWRWVQSNALSLTMGEQYLRLFMAEDGVKVDAIFLARGTTPQPPCQNGATNNECASEISANGGSWSYATTPDVYSPGTCNGADRSPTDDNILATGALATCYADHDGGGATVKHVFDLSGNVKEWTLARQPGQNPIRGGGSSDTGMGTTCELNFNLGTDTFFFPNVGFRCCR